MDEREEPLVRSSTTTRWMDWRTFSLQARSGLGPRSRPIYLSYIALLFMHMHDRVARGWQLGQWKEEFIQVQWEVSRQIGQAVEESSQQSSNTLNQKLERGRKREREEKFVQVDHTDEITFKKVVKSLKFRKSYIQLKEIISMHGEHSEMSAVAENGSNYN